MSRFGLGATGDLMYYNAVTGGAKALAVGADGEVLKADSSVAGVGLAWGAAAAIIPSDVAYHGIVAPIAGAVFTNATNFATTILPCDTTPFLVDTGGAGDIGFTGTDLFEVNTSGTSRLYRITAQIEIVVAADAGQAGELLDLGFELVHSVDALKEVRKQIQHEIHATVAQTYLVEVSGVFRMTGAETVQLRMMSPVNEPATWSATIGVTDFSVNDIGAS